MSESVSDHIKGVYTFICFVFCVAFLFGPVFFVTASSAAFHGTTWTEEQTLMAQRPVPLTIMCAMMAMQIAMLVFGFVSQDGLAVSAGLALTNFAMYPLSWIIYTIWPLGWLIYCLLWLVIPLWALMGMTYYITKPCMGSVVCTILHFGLCWFFYSAFTA